MPSIKGRVNDFLQRQLTFVANTNSGNSDNRNGQVRRSQSFKENESNCKRKTSSSTSSTSKHQLSSCSPSTTKTATITSNKKENNGIKMGTFITNYLNGHVNKHQPDIICGKTCYDLPVKRINKLSPKIVAAFTGPEEGLTSVNNKNEEKPFQIDCDNDISFIDDDLNNNNNCTNDNNNLNKQQKQQQQQQQQYQIHQPRSSTSSYSTSSVSSTNCSPLPSPTENTDDEKFFKTATLPLGQDCAGIANWNRSSEYAFGISTTLYECHPQTYAKAGEPIADAFAISVRENSAILCLADGVNWGEKACIAARSAIHGSMDYLNKAIYHESGRIQNTLDIFVALLRSFSAAHNLILKENGLLTTLTVAIVTQLENSDSFIVCTCNVGDSLAYIYSKEFGVREVTQGSHDIFSMRDMRDALGALGPVDGQNPELNNLTVAMTICDKGDIVFLTSDGVSDNFDPVVGKFALPKKIDKRLTSKVNDEKTALQLNESIIANKNTTKGKKSSSSSSSTAATTVASTATKASRRLIENITNATSKHSRSRVHRSNSNPDKLLKQHYTHQHQHINSHNNNKNLKLTTNHTTTTTTTTTVATNNNKKSNLSHSSNHNHLSANELPTVSPEQRHALALLRMEDLLFNGVNSGEKQCSTAKHLCEIMIEFVKKLTMAKRHILEDPELYTSEDQTFDQSEQKHRRRKVYDKLAMVPGKLDHATIVAYQVGFYGEMENKNFNKCRHLQEKNHDLRLKATLAQIDDLH